MSPSAKDIALQRLKDILLSKDRQRLAELDNELKLLQRQIADKESLIETLEPVIADVLDRKIVNSKDEFIEILAPVIGGSIKKQVSEAKDDIVDALYPVIGKTIRKSVAEAMKNLVNSVNERIEKSLQSIIVFNLFKSKVTGISQAELLLRRALPFRIRELFLFRKENGLLIAHTSAGDSQSGVDQELLGGLITAIQDFAPSAFAHSPKQDLYEFEYGDSKVRIDIQNNFYIAAFIQGVMPNDFPDKLRKLGNRIHNRFYKTIREFDGDARPLEGIVAMLKSFLDSFSPVSVEETKKARPFVLYLGAAALFLAAVFCGIRYGLPYLKDRQLAQNVEKVILSDSTFRNDDIQVSARRGHITLSGDVTSLTKKARIDSMVRTVADVNDVSNKVLIFKENKDLIKSINTVLLPYLESGESDIQFIIEKDQVILEGYVPDPLTKSDISRVISDIDGVRSVVNNITHVKKNKVDELGAALEATKIRFAKNDTTLNPDYFRRLDYIAAKMAQLEDCILVIQGYSDDIASSEYNLTISQKRALSVADYMIEKSIAQERIKVEFYGEDNPIASNADETGRSINRRVELKLSGSHVWHNL